MSKRLFFGFVICGLFLITGCSSKNLNCTRESDYSSEMSMKQVLTIKFKGEHVSYLDMKMNVLLSDSYIDFKDSLIESIESEFSNFNGKRGVSYSTSDNVEGFDFRVKINFDKLDDNSKKDIDIVNYEKSYDSIKSELEESGYICK